jgi:hypothetical protein
VLRTGIEQNKCMSETGQEKDGMATSETFHDSQPWLGISVQNVIRRTKRLDRNRFIWAQAVH